MDEKPFPELMISDSSFLHSAKERRKCGICGRSRKYYCYTCYTTVANDDITNKIPKVKLPIKIDILKHPNECDGKSTSPHAAVLAPDDVTIYDYPCVPDYDHKKTILIFPCKDAVEIKEIIGEDCVEINKTSVDKKLADGKQEQNISGNVSGATMQPSTDEVEDGRVCSENMKRGVCKPWFDKVVFIDSTWNQTTTIANDERLKHITRVELKKRKTKFWRNHAGNPEEYLSTIEAIYYFLRDYHELCVDSQYHGDYDNLLFFFNFIYNQIRSCNNGGQHLKAYSKRLKTE